MNVISVLQRIATQAKTAEGKAVAPVAWDCNCLEEVCGACTMVVNGRVRQACSALVDRLLEEQPGEIELRPMTKFPVVRDLFVDRSRLFRALQKVKAWIPADGYYDLGPGPRQSQEEQQRAYPLSECMSCGCCLEACPQYVKVEFSKQDDESDANFTARKQAAYDESFLGAHAISQVMLFNAHPTGRMNAAERLESLTGPGGVHVCGNAQNCVEVCPKSIPLTTSIGRAGRAATLHAIKRWFGA
jgi:succinate dehydrogenase / fumarate reductase iron-sulfur subunit